MCEVEFGELPISPSERIIWENHNWAVCVANKAAQRPGEWCMVLRLEEACNARSPECKEFDSKRDSLYELTIWYRYYFQISQKLGITGSASGELWIRQPKGLIQKVKELFTKPNWSWNE